MRTIYNQQEIGYLDNSVNPNDTIYVNRITLLSKQMQDNNTALNQKINNIVKDNEVKEQQRNYEIAFINWYICTPWYKKLWWSLMRFDINIIKEKYNRYIIAK